jgi:hypothetical protein
VIGKRGALFAIEVGRRIASQQRVACSTRRVLVDQALRQKLAGWTKLAGASDAHAVAVLGAIRPGLSGWTISSIPGSAVLQNRILKKGAGSLHVFGGAKLCCKADAAALLALAWDASAGRACSCLVGFAKDALRATVEAGGAAFAVVIFTGALAAVVLGSLGVFGAVAGLDSAVAAFA